MRNLISGTHSGLGQFLLSELGGTRWDRESEIDREESFDAIIHCAWPPSPPESHRLLGKYLDDTLQNACKLLSVRHKKFVFISSIDVYPKQLDDDFNEDKEIPLDCPISIHGIHKLLVESLVLNKTDNFIIIRCGALLGQTMRMNSLRKIIECEKPEISLSKESSFNLVLQNDLSEFIKLCVLSDKIGVYNFVSTDNITLGEVVDKLNVELSWGNFTYKSPNVSNAKSARIFPAINKTSFCALDAFICQNASKPKAVLVQ